jgi:hypothetical protein
VLDSWDGSTALAVRTATEHLSRRESTTTGVVTL